MIECILTRIWIGGRILRSQSHHLVIAVKKARVSHGSPGWEHIICKPMSIDGLLEGAVEGILHYQDDAALDGELPLLTRACHRVGLTYRLWHEATTDEGCRVEVWEPGMSEPVRLLGDPLDPFTHLVESLPVQLAINHLRSGEIEEALSLLERACPSVPEVPPLELIED